MKDLKTLLEGLLSSNNLDESSILADTEDTLSINNPYKDKYPIPGINDYFLNRDDKSITYTWECKDLMQLYVKNLKISKYDVANQQTNISKLGKIRVTVYRNGKYRNAVKIRFREDDWYNEVEIYGVDIPGKTQAEQKKECIKFFKALLDNPELFTKIVNRSNEVCDDGIPKRIMYTEL